MMKIRLKSLLLLLAGLQSCHVIAGVSPYVDLLLWHPAQETSSFWAGTITEPNSHETVYTPSNNRFNWDLGVRLGFLYAPDSNWWDTSIHWTYFSSNKKNHVPAEAQLIAPEFFSGFLSKDLFFGADTNWKLNLNMIDLNISHPITVGHCFTFRPAVGIKGGTIHQTIDSNWDAVIYKSTEHLTHKFQGIGPSFGLQTQWHFYPSVSLIGDFSTAFLWGNWKVEDTYSRPSALFGLISPTKITTSMDDSSLGTLMFDYFLGLEWRFFSKNNLSVQLGYELQFWANHLRLTTFQLLPTHGDLTLQGGTCRIQIDF